MERETQDPVKLRMTSIAVTLTQALDPAEHDLSLAGLRPKKKDKISSPDNNVLFATLLELPKHFFVQLARTVPTLVALLISYGIGAVVFRIAKEASLLDRASAIEMMYYQYYGSKSLGAAVLSLTIQGSCNVAFGGMFYLPLLFLWNYRLSLEWVLKVVGLSSTFQIMASTTLVVAPFSFHPNFRPTPLWACLTGAVNMMMMAAVPFTIWSIWVCWKALKKLRNPVWCWMFILLNMSIMNLSYVYLFILRFLMGMPDVAKLLFVVLVNGPLMEALSVLSRFTARSVRHNDPTTSWMPICVGVVFKKLWMRFVVGSMKSSVVVSVAAVMVGLLEILGRVTMPIRDKWTYRKLFARHLTEEQNVLSMMTAARSRSLRAETESLEGVLDMAFIIIGCAWPYMYSLSLDGKGLPSLTALVEKAVIQWVLESTLDVVICLILAVVQNYHILSHARIKCQYWSLVVALLSFLVSLMLPLQTIGYIICSKPDFPDGVEFMFCSSLHA